MFLPFKLFMFVFVYSNPTIFCICLFKSYYGFSLFIQTLLLFVFVYLNPTIICVCLFKSYYYLFIQILTLFVLFKSYYCLCFSREPQ